jgi:hypothetical protein
MQLEVVRWLLAGGDGEFHPNAIQSWRDDAMINSFDLFVFFWYCSFIGG